MRILAKVVPRKLKQKYEANAKYARMKDVERAVGFFIFNGLLLSLVLAFIASRFFSIYAALLAFFIIFIFIEMFFYYSLVFMA